MGPTAAGKTDCAIALAETTNVELVSVDSVMVYRGLDIGSAKPDYPHHLLNLCDPTEHYSVANYCNDCELVLNDIWARGKTPVLVGGTMLYFRALQFGMHELPATNPELRAKLHSELEQHGLAAMYQRLASIDAKAAAKLRTTDTHRILRALEINILSGKNLEQNFQAKTQPLLPAADCFVVNPYTREELHERIARRFDLMLELGFMDEAAALYARGDLHTGLPAIRSVGYRQAFDCFDNKFSVSELRERVIAATRQLAKRQLTWLRSWPRIINIDPSNKKDMDKIVSAIPR